MAKVKVESAVFRKEGEGKFGKWYLYEVKLVGDDKTYQYMAKKNPQDKFVPGQEVEAEIETKQNGAYTNHNIKPVQQGGFGGGGGYNNAGRLELDRKVAALNNAVAMVASGKVAIDNLKATYEKFLEYLG